jgi:ubiquinone/menaquinone biosynthesis C-methylase UbiE
MGEDRMSQDQHERLTRTRSFFGVRAAGWDTKFSEDDAAFAAAVAEAGIPESATVADIGCGTGRALPVLRDRIGPDGTLLALDVTPEMVQVARARAAQTGAGLLLADAMNLPLPDGCLNVVFAAGLLSHLPDPVLALAELGRVSADSGQLVLFHPIGRAALAAKHGRQLTDQDTQAAPVLTSLLSRTGWILDSYDDAPHRFLAVAHRG